MTHTDFRTGLQSANELEITVTYLLMRGVRIVAHLHCGKNRRLH
jgi:hypothetical protein